MSGGRAAPFGLGRLLAACAGWRSNTIHRGIHSRRRDQQQVGAVHNAAPTYPQDEVYKLGSDGRFWPAGYLDGDNGLPGNQLWDGGWHVDP